MPLPLIALGSLLAPLSSTFMSAVNARNVDLTTNTSKEIANKQQETQLKLAYLNLAHQSALEERREGFQADMEMSRQLFQARLANLQFGQQLTLEGARQEFQLRMNSLQNQQQREIQEFIQSVNLAINQGNLNFQRWRFEQETALQRELAKANRELQLTLAQYQRETALLLPEIHKILDNWPLNLAPSQILNSHHNSGLIPLRVFISPPDVDFDRFNHAPNQNFPKLEKKLAEGLGQVLNQHYQLNSSVRPTELLDGAWESKRFRGGASIKALFGMLKSEPTLILESEVDGDHLNLRVAYWGFGQNNYCYERIISRLPYRDILYESAKNRAIKWQETRQKLLVAGEGANLEEIDRKYGEDNPDNFQCWQSEKRLREAGVVDNEMKINYHINYKDWEYLSQVLILCHSLVAAWIADAHYLIHYDVNPILPELLPSLINDQSVLPVKEVLAGIVSGYQNLFKAVAIEQPHRVPDLALYLAKGLAILPDKSFSHEMLNYSLQGKLSLS